MREFAWTVASKLKPAASYCSGPNWASLTGTSLQAVYPFLALGTDSVCLIAESSFLFSSSRPIPSKCTSLEVSWGPRHVSARQKPSILPSNCQHQIHTQDALTPRLHAYARLMLFHSSSTTMCNCYWLRPSSRNQLGPFWADWAFSQAAGAHSPGTVRSKP